MRYIGTVLVALLSAACDATVLSGDQEGRGGEVRAQVTPAEVYHCDPDWDSSKRWQGPPVGANTVLAAMESAGFRGEYELTTGLGIAMAESLLCVHAHNPGTSPGYRGIWQISTQHFNYSDDPNAEARRVCYDVWAATRVARDLYLNGGWGHWEVYTLPADDVRSWRHVEGKARGDVQLYLCRKSCAGWCIAGGRCCTGCSPGCPC